MIRRYEKEKHKASALLLANIGQLLTLRTAASGPRRGASLSDLGIIEECYLITDQLGE